MTSQPNYEMMLNTKATEVYGTYGHGYRQSKWKELWKSAVTLLAVASLFCFMWFQSDTIRQAVLSPSLSQGRVAASQPQRLTSGEHKMAAIPYIYSTPSNDKVNCQKDQLRKSFADLDYALLGYNILKGYPHAIGHDPGFTLPLFNSNYSDGGRTADCRYQVPDGLMVIPDVSCVTSFSSQIVRTRYQFSSMLSVSAHIDAGVDVDGWGAKFSASAGFQDSINVIASGKTVFIISRANCNYYYTRLYQNNLPQFNKLFVQWVKRLNNTDVQDDYLEFFDTFGTHFPVSVTFGASLTYEFKMSTSEYKSEMSKGINIEVSASYTGEILSADGGFKLNTNQKNKADNFSEKVETRVISVGAPPPADHSPDTWASTVKDSPLPTSFALQSIENLFTKQYMSSLGVDYPRIKANIEEYKGIYCEYLKDKHLLDTCEIITPGIILNGTFVTGYYKTMALSFSDCIKTCSLEVGCEAISYCQGCTQADKRICYMFNNSLSIAKTARNNTLFETVIFPEKIESTFTITDTVLLGTELGFDEGQWSNTTSYVQCLNYCTVDAYCSAISYNISATVDKCRLFSKNGITGLKTVSDIDTYFIPYHL